MTFRIARTEQVTSKTLLLVVPPQKGLLEGFSTGLVSIANYVSSRNPGVDVRLLDLGLASSSETTAEVSHALLTAVGRVFVGITGTTASYQNMLATARLFKSQDPTCVVILGGHHVTTQDDVVLKHHSDVIDFIIRGEGEVAVSSLLDNYPNTEIVPNLSFIISGGLKRTLEAPLLAEPELDRLGPTYLGAGFRSSAGKFDHVTYVSARGCPLKCSFCVVRASAIRSKSITAIISDLRYLVHTRGHRDLAIEDNFFAHQPKRTIEICAAIEKLQRELPFRWDCQTRVESMRRKDVARAMARAGCAAAYLGVEALVPEQLVYLNKTPQPARYLEALEHEALPTMLEAGLAVYLNLQLGLPGETQADREAALRLLSRLGAIAGDARQEITMFPQLNVIYPGTPHFDMAVQRGYFGPLGREVFEAFTAWEADDEPILRYLGEHFAHGVGGIPLGILDRHKLKTGRFRICTRALADVSTQLRRMEEISGITVFRYGKYLAKPEARRAAALA